MKDLMKVVYFVFGFAAIAVLWPNLVHEPLHLFALNTQGLSGSIHFDWRFPATPYIERIGQVQSIAGGLWYVLAPSIASVLILLALWRWKTRSLFTHVVLPTYLAFDLVVNVAKYANPSSDFHFLVALPFWLPFVLVAGVGALAMLPLTHGLRHMLGTGVR